MGQQSDHTLGTFGLPGCNTSMICSKQQQVSSESNQPTVRLEVQAVSVDITHKLFSEKQSVGHKLASAYRAALLGHLGGYDKSLRYSDL